MKVAYYNTEIFSKNEQNLKNILSEQLQKLEKDRLPFTTLDFIADLILRVEKIKPFIERFNHLLLLGVGGSALGAQALQESFYPQNRQVLFQDKGAQKDKKQFWLADNVDMHYFNDCLKTLPPEETLVLVISKSGSTLETMSQYFICKNWLKKKLPNSWKEHFIAITDAKKGFLRQEVDEFNYISLEIPDELGGRFSVYSAVGILPAAFLGIDYKKFLAGARDACNDFFKQSNAYLENTSCNLTNCNNVFQSSLPDVFKMAYFTHEAMENNFSELILFNYLPKWSALGAWFRQLWAESLGKNGHGSTPIPALGATDQHSILQLFLDGKRNKACIFVNQHNFVEKNNEYIENNSDCIIPHDLPEEWKYIAGKTLAHILEAEGQVTKESLINVKTPLMDLEIQADDEYNFGKITWNFGLMTILTAYFIGINPLDQPAVEEGKIIAKKMLSTY